jgi:hypothetical protein
MRVCVYTECRTVTERTCTHYFCVFCLTALMEVLNVPWQSVLAAASGRSGLWTAVQYAEAALLL